MYQKELALSTAFKNRTHVYEFSVPPGYHIMDTEYTFYDGLSDAVDTPAKQMVAVGLQQYIVAFAATGKPSPQQLPPIPIYGSGKVLNLTVDGFPVVNDPWATKANAFLNSRQYN